MRPPDHLTADINSVHLTEPLSQCASDSADAASNFQDPHRFRLPTLADVF